MHRRASSGGPERLGWNGQHWSLGRVSRERQPGQGTAQEKDQEVGRSKWVKEFGEECASCATEQEQVCRSRCAGAQCSKGGVGDGTEGESCTPPHPARVQRHACRARELYQEQGVGRVRDLPNLPNPRLLRDQGHLTNLSWAEAPHRGPRLTDGEPAGTRQEHVLGQGQTEK
jgi:hypothetical protein